MEGDPFLLIEGMAIAGHRGRRDQGLHLHPLGISASRSTAMQPGHRHGARARPAGPGGAGLRLRLRPGGARRRRRLCLRRGDLAAGEPGGQARRGARQAAAAGAQGPVRPADGDQQRPVAGRRPRHPGRRARRPTRDFGFGRSRGTMPIQLAGNIKHGGLFEIAFGVTLGELVDDIGGGTRVGRPVRAVQVGGPLGAYFPRVAVRHALRLRGLRRPRRADRPRRRRGVRRHRRHGRSRRGSRWSSARSRAAASARPAGSARRAASRSSTGSSPARTARRNLALLDDLATP